jgi:glycosyltransferase involved in cell wall biosynthesis
LRFWIVTIGEPLPIEPGSRPLRSRLLARELARRGHEVRWWTSDFNHFAKVRHPVDATHMDSGEGYQLSFLHGRGYQRNLSLDRQINHIQIARHFRTLAQDGPVPDVIVCSFPSIELASEVVRYAKEHGIPCAIDIRDLWPDEFFNRVPAAIRSLARGATLPLTAIVKSMMRRADMILGVSARYLQWGLAHAGRAATDNDAVIPLGYPDHPEAKAMRRQRSNKGDKGECTFLFSGSFNQSVDLDCVIAAFGKLPNAPIRAILCGDGENASRWREAAKGDPRISFVGWCSADEIRANAAEADAGLVCYRPGSLVAMPNKLFEYMSFGLPIINSISGEAGDLVQDTDTGLNYLAGNVDSLATTLLQMSVSAGLRRKQSQNATDLFEARFSGAAIIEEYADRLVELYAKNRASVSKKIGLIQELYK